MLWAVAAIQRAARLENARHDELAKSLMAAFDGPLKAPEGLPAFQADPDPVEFCRALAVAATRASSCLPPNWTRRSPAVGTTPTKENFWKDTGWIAGFTEMPRGSQGDFMDVDSGPVLCGIGSVASAFGIGAAKTVGRIDHAAPLTMEVVACSWPTPFGFLIPGLMGRLAVKSWSLGEVALLFSMTRPTLAAETVPFEGHVPLHRVGPPCRLRGRGPVLHLVRDSELPSPDPTAQRTMRGAGHALAEKALVKTRFRVVF